MPLLNPENLQFLHTLVIYVNASKNRDVKITEDYGNLKPSEGSNVGCCIVNVRTSVGLRTFAIATLMMLTLAQTAQAGDWPIKRHDLAHSSVANRVVEPPLELLWQYTIGNEVWSFMEIHNRMHGWFFPYYLRQCCLYGIFG